MTVHIERCHHRTTVKRGRRDWRARCHDCGFSQAAARWHDAFRALLTDAEGKSIPRPNVIGAVIAGLRKRGVLVEIGWRTTTDSKSGNSGKPARVHRLIKRPH